MRRIKGTFRKIASIVVATSMSFTTIFATESDISKSIFLNDDANVPPTIEDFDENYAQILDEMYINIGEIETDEIANEQIYQKEELDLFTEEETNENINEDLQEEHIDEDDNNEALNKDDEENETSLEESEKDDEKPVLPEPEVITPEEGSGLSQFYISGIVKAENTGNIFIRIIRFFLGNRDIEGVKVCLISDDVEIAHAFTDSKGKYEFFAEVDIKNIENILIEATKEGFSGFRAYFSDYFNRDLKTKLENIEEFETEYEDLTDTDSVSKEDVYTVDVGFLLEISQGIHIYGAVYNEFYEVISGASIHFNDGYNYVEIETDENGKYELILESGARYTVYARTAFEENGINTEIISEEIVVDTIGLNTTDEFEQNFVLGRVLERQARNFSGTIWDRGQNPDVERDMEKNAKNGDIFIYEDGRELVVIVLDNLNDLEAFFNNDISLSVPNTSNHQDYDAWIPVFSHVDSFLHFKNIYPLDQLAAGSPIKNVLEDKTIMADGSTAPDGNPGRDKLVNEREYSRFNDKEAHGHGVLEKYILISENFGDKSTPIDISDVEGLERFAGSSIFNGNGFIITGNVKIPDLEITYGGGITNIDLNNFFSNSHEPNDMSEYNKNFYKPLRDYENGYGLFRNVSNGEFKNLTLSNLTVTMKDNTDKTEYEHIVAMGNLIGLVANIDPPESYKGDFEAREQDSGFALYHNYLAGTYKFGHFNAPLVIENVYYESNEHHIMGNTLDEFSAGGLIGKVAKHKVGKLSLDLSNPFSFLNRTEYRQNVYHGEYWAEDNSFLWAYYSVDAFFRELTLNKNEAILDANPGLSLNDRAEQEIKIVYADRTGEVDIKHMFHKIEGDAVDADYDDKTFYSGGIIGKIEAGSVTIDNITFETYDMVFETSSSGTPSWIRHKSGIIMLDLFDATGHALAMPEGWSNKVKGGFVGGIVSQDAFLRINCPNFNENENKLTSMNFYSKAVGGLVGKIGHGSVVDINDAKVDALFDHFDEYEDYLELSFGGLVGKVEGKLIVDSSYINGGIYNENRYELSDEGLFYAGYFKLYLYLFHSKNPSDRGASAIGGVIGRISGDGDVKLSLVDNKFDFSRFNYRHETEAEYSSGVGFINGEYGFIPAKYIGGFVGEISGKNLTISQSSNTASVTGGGVYVGGMLGGVKGAGTNVEIDESYYIGMLGLLTNEALSPSLTAKVGGFIGIIEDAAVKVENSYAISSVVNSPELPSDQIDDLGDIFSTAIGEGYALMQKVYVSGSVPDVARGVPIKGVGNGSVHVYYDKSALHGVGNYDLDVDNEYSSAIKGVSTRELIRIFGNGFDTKRASWSVSDNDTTGLQRGSLKDNLYMSYPFLAWQTKELSFDARINLPADTKVDSSITLEWDNSDDYYLFNPHNSLINVIGVPVVHVLGPGSSGTSSFLAPPTEPISIGLISKENNLVWFNIGNGIAGSADINITIPVDFLQWHSLEVLDSNGNSIDKGEGTNGTIASGVFGYSDKEWTKTDTRGGIYSMVYKPRVGNGFFEGNGIFNVYVNKVQKVEHPDKGKPFFDRFGANYELVEEGDVTKGTNEYSLQIRNRLDIVGDTPSNDINDITYVDLGLALKDGRQQLGTINRDDNVLKFDIRGEYGGEYNGYKIVSPVLRISFMFEFAGITSEADS